MVAVGSKLVFDLRMVDCIRLAGGGEGSKAPILSFRPSCQRLAAFFFRPFFILEGLYSGFLGFFVYWLPDEDKQAIYRFMAYPVLMSQHSLGLPLTNGGRNGQERQTAQEAKYTQV